MARTFAYLFGLGAVLAGVSYLLIPDDSVSPGVLAFALAAALFAGLMVVGYDRLPAWMFRWLPLAGTLCASGVVYYGGTAMLGSYAMFYFWVALSAFYFFSMRWGLLVVAATAVTYGAVLAARGEGAEPAAMWVMAVGTLCVAGLLIGVLRRRIEVLVARLTEAARTDVLTGLVNRRGFEESFELELERARRGKRPVALVMGDLDFFKDINDRLGHQAGDEALEKVAKIMRDHIRRIDLAARVGGEEFAIVLPEADEHAAYMLAERVRRAIREGRVGRVGNNDQDLTISCGIAAFPKHGSSIDSLMRAADEALYLAKALGKDRVVVFNAEMVLPGDLERARRRPGRDGAMATVLALAETLDLRHTGRSDHCRAVAAAAEAIARELGLPEERVEQIRLAGMLHDVGKIGVPDEILSKPGALDAGEWPEVRRHPEIGCRILDNSGLPEVADWVHAHHERPDGTGYPRGLTADEVPLEASILAVADAWEGMTSDRSHRMAMTEDQARAELIAGAGTQFDERVVEATLAVLDREGPPLPSRR